MLAVSSHGIRDGKTQDETRYLITSLHTGANELLRSIRQRSPIESSWHCVRDVPMREDAHRHREDLGEQTLATLRSMVFSVLRLEGILSITVGTVDLA